jgi:hypothetical protein
MQVNPNQLLGMGLRQSIRLGFGFWASLRR